MIIVNLILPRALDDILVRTCSPSSSGWETGEEGEIARERGLTCMFWLNG